MFKFRFQVLETIMRVDHQEMVLLRTKIQATLEMEQLLKQEIRMVVTHNKTMVLNQQVIKAEKIVQHH